MSSESRTLELGSDLGIEQAGALQQTLARPSRGKSALRLGLSRIDKLHSATLQVLCALVRDRALARRTTHIDAPAELRDAAALLGVAEILGL